MTSSINNIRNHIIICAKEYDVCIHKAIETMQNILETVVGYQIPIKSEEEPKDAFEIVIGVTNRDTTEVKKMRSELKNDGYILLMQDNCLFITGSTSRGTAYGIYSFLEDYVGVRFCSSDYTAIPKAIKLDIPKDLRVSYSPYFEHRDVFWFDYIKHLDFAIKNKINVAASKWVDTGYSVYAGNGVHTLNILNGAPTHVHGEPQPCLSDENVYQRVLGNVKKQLDKHPSAKIVSVSQNDGGNAEKEVCQCEKCVAINRVEESYMGNMLNFVNRIADGLKEEYPDIIVDTLAYQYTKKPPKHMVARENVCVRICPESSSFSRALNDVECVTNREFKETLEAWGRNCKRMYIWDYSTNFSYELAPFPNLHVLLENVKFYKENGVRGVLSQGNYCSKSPEFEELRGYLLAKVLWNPDMSQEEYLQYMDGFLEDYYGEGWQYIREYIDHTSAEAAKHDMKFWGIWAEPDYYLPIKDEEGKMHLEILDYYTSLWEKAYAAATTEEHRKHVKKSSLQNEFYCLYMNFDNQVKRHEEFWKSIKEFGITEVCEAHKVPGEIDYNKDIRTYVCNLYGTV